MSDPSDGTARYAWPAGRRLAEDLPNLIQVRGQRVADLGCGPGTMGRTALDLDAAAVGFFDGDTDAIHALTGLDPRATAHLHFWGAPLPDGPWPLILGSDILYRDQYVGDLCASIAASLSPDGTALLSDPRDDLAHARTCALDAGLHVHQERRPGGYTLLVLRHFRAEIGLDAGMTWAPP